jgi:hypothetical protein
MTILPTYLFRQEKAAKAAKVENSELERQRDNHNQDQQELGFR